MKNGIYKLIFNTNVNNNGNLDGIVVIDNETINGGDYVCYYQGVVNGNKASVKSIPHNSKDTNAFNGKSPLDLELTLEGHGNHYLFKGHLKGDPSSTIQGQLNYLNHLIRKI